MKKENDLEIVCRLGLKPVYARAESFKRKLAYEYCMGILEKIKSWETDWRDAKRSFDRSAFYGRWIVEADLSETQRVVFFWKTLADEIERDTKSFYDAFPEEYHFYSEENFIKLCNWLEDQRWSGRNADTLKGFDVKSAISELLEEKICRKRI